MSRDEDLKIPQQFQERWKDVNWDDFEVQMILLPYCATHSESPRNFVQSLLSTCTPVLLLQQLHGGGAGEWQVSVAVLTIDISFQIDKTRIRPISPTSAK